MQYLAYFDTRLWLCVLHFYLYFLLHAPHPNFKHLLNVFTLTLYTKNRFIGSKHHARALCFPRFNAFGDGEALFQDFECAPVCFIDWFVLYGMLALLSVASGASATQQLKPRARSLFAL